jgi:hypothetical protein
LDKTIREYAELIGPDIPGADISFIPNADKTGCLLRPMSGPNLHPHILSEWAERQLYTHFGVRPKWFTYVESSQQATELNLRLHSTPKHKFRTLRDAGSELFLVRGFVSPVYADVPDTKVMDSLLEAFGSPDRARVLPGAGKTDQCLYAHVINADAVALPTAAGGVFAGVTVMNSEVGYTSVRVVPVMYWDWCGQVVPIPSGKLFKRIHRGNFDNLVQDFRDAVEANKRYVGDVADMMKALENVTYQSADDAASALYAAVVAARGTRGFAQECTTAYSSSNRLVHTGVGIVQVIAEVAAKSLTQDEQYTLASIAGAVAVHLVQ